MLKRQTRRHPFNQGFRRGMLKTLLALRCRGHRCQVHRGLFRGDLGLLQAILVVVQVQVGNSLLLVRPKIRFRSSVLPWRTVT